MKFSRSFFAGVFLHLACLSQSHAQQPDSLLNKESVSNLRQTYLNEIGDNAQIYHGSEYIRNGQKAIGFPYFESDNMLSGSIYYQGVEYLQRNLYYDLVSDEIISNNFPHNAQITLSPEKADSFRIGTRVFIQLYSNKLNGLSRDGYYEQLYSGEPGVFAKREKKLVSGTGSDETKYIQYNSYYIKVKNVFYEIEGKNTLLDLLKDKQDDLKKYIRTNKLNFKKNLESSVVLTTIYYSQLKR
jgi:hypothetical protein